MANESQQAVAELTAAVAQLVTANNALVMENFWLRQQVERLSGDMAAHNRMASGPQRTNQSMST